MPRLAFVSPLPPAPTGIADYAADVLQLLASRHEVDAFHDQAEVDADRLPAGVGAWPARRLEGRERECRYDGFVYQMGNAPDHAFEYELLARRPGLLVLHDLVLHHARARAFLEAPEVLAYRGDPSDAPRRQAARRRLAEYRDELAHSYPAQADRLAEAQLGTVGTLLPYAYPLFRLPVEASRAVAVHNDFMAQAVRDEVPGVPVCRIAMRVEPLAVSAEDVAATRTRLGLAHDAIVVVAFGLMTREKRLDTVARAVARAAVHEPRLRLLLVGEVPDRAGLEARLDTLGARERTILAGRVPRAALAAHLTSADLAIHLRYPTARETSAALLRLLAQGLPVVATDLENLAEIPGEALVRVDPTDEEGAVTRSLLDLATRPERRRALGERARAFIEREHSAARCAGDYEAAIALSLAQPARALPRPAHWPVPWTPGDGER